ncbi:MAG: hypothetical protein WCH57_09260 [Verrucomicrobiota bacterium]
MGPLFSSARSCATVVCTANRSAAAAFPQAPMRPASAGSRKRDSNAPASASGSRSPTSNPVSPWVTISGIPASRVETTGKPAAMASAMTVGSVSMPPPGSLAQARTKRADALNNRRTSSWGWGPARRTHSPTPRSAMRARRDSSSGPPPTITHSKSRPRPRKRAQASIKVA